jgi:hypothetical protein
VNGRKWNDTEILAEKVELLRRESQHKIFDNYNYSNEMNKMAEKYQSLAPIEVKKTKKAKPRKSVGVDQITDTLTKMNQ